MIVHRSVTNQRLRISGHGVALAGVILGVRSVVDGYVVHAEAV